MRKEKEDREVKRIRGKGLRYRMAGIVLRRIDAIGKFGLSRSAGESYFPSERVRKPSLSFVYRVTDCIENGKDAEGRSLNVTRLLGFGDAAFWHDVIGIGANYDTRTRKIGNFFVPMCGYGDED